MKKALIIAKPKTIQYIVLRNSYKSAGMGKIRLPLSFPNAILNHQVGASFLLFLLMTILPSFNSFNFIIEVMHPLKRKLYGNFYKIPSLERKFCQAAETLLKLYLFTIL